jgi:hypothetical protein
MNNFLSMEKIFSNEKSMDSRYIGIKPYSVHLNLFHVGIVQHIGALWQTFPARFCPCGI